MATIGSLALLWKNGEALETHIMPMGIFLAVCISVAGAMRYVNFVYVKETSSFRNDLSKADYLSAMLFYGFNCVWSTHFSAMNSQTFSEGMTIYYELPSMVVSGVFPLIASGLVTRELGKIGPAWTPKVGNTQPAPTLAIGHAVLRLCRRMRPHGHQSLVALRCATLMTLGIALMHYFGMASISGVYNVHSLASIALTAVTCVAMNFVAMWLMVKLPERQERKTGWFVLAAVALSAGVIVPHCTSQYMVTFQTVKSPSPPVGQLRGGTGGSAQVFVNGLNFLFGALLGSALSNSAKFSEHLHSSSAAFSKIKQKVHSTTKSGSNDSTGQIAESEGIEDGASLTGAGVGDLGGLANDLADPALAHPEVVVLSNLNNYILAEI